MSENFVFSLPLRSPFTIFVGEGCLVARVGICGYCLGATGCLAEKRIFYMKLSDNWFTTVTESDNGAVMFVSGRDEVDAFMESGKLRERVEITWPYESDAQGMPTEEESMRMEAPQEALRKAMEKDKLAILTGIYTGDGARTWVFYTRNIPAFGERLNQALAPFEQLPITIYTEKDAEWNEYREMRTLCGDACRDLLFDDDEE